MNKKRHELSQAFASICVRSRFFLLAFALSSNAEPPSAFPNRIHVFEDYETEIEKRWWLRGAPETANLAPSLSASVPNTRACRAAPSKNFDRKTGDQTVDWKAVIFNPVPGPPMGKQTRLRFRYWLKGTDTVRVQIFSLSKGYHRFLTLSDLPNGLWQSADVDMTTARRPDGSGGPLSEDERIDDIQFYIDPSAELIIDDIVLYDAAPADEVRAFPSRVIFTGWFDTGVQGKEWPGEFEIVPHAKPRTWDAIRAVSVPKCDHMARVHLRGERVFSARTELRFKYRMKKRSPLIVSLHRAGSQLLPSQTIESTVAGTWREHRVALHQPDPLAVDSIHIHAADDAGELLLDDIVIYEPPAPSSKLDGKLICCGGPEVYILDLAKIPPVKVWSWRATEANGIPAAMIPRFRSTDDCKPIDGGRRILISSSSGGVALVDRATGKAAFHATVGNAHSVEWLPRGRIAVAGSVREDGNCVALFDAKISGKELFRDDLHSGHGLFWDASRNLLWALGYDELRSYQLADWESASPKLEHIRSFKLPDDGGHDLSPIGSGKSLELIVTTEPSVWRFVVAEERFAPLRGLASEDHVKCVSIRPRSGQIAVINASHAHWWSDRIHFFRPEAELPLNGERLYKVRWLPQ